MSFFARILKNSSQSVLSGLTGAVGSFVAAGVVGRVLGVNGTATVGMALWIVFLAITLSDVGITGTLSRFIAAERDDVKLRAIYSYGARVFVAAILFGLCIAALFLFVYWNDIRHKYAASDAEAWGFVAVVLACFVVHMLFAFSFQVLRGLMRFSTIARLTVLGVLLQIALVIVGSRYLGANGAMIGYLGSSLPMLWALGAIRPTRERLPPDERRAITVYARTFYGTALFSPLLWVRVDVILVDQFRGSAAVGLFVAAATVAAMLLQVSLMVCNALAPNIMHAAVEGEEEFRRASRTAVLFGVFVLLPACSIGAALAPQAVAIVYGNAFAASGVAAAILSLAVAPSAITLVCTTVLNATDSNRVLVRNGMVGAALTIGVGVILVWQAGLIGAAVSRLFAQTVVAVLNLVALNRRVKGLVRLAWLGPILFSSLAAGLAALWVRQLGLGLLPALLSLAVGGTTYLVLVVLTMRISADESAAASSVIATLPPALRRPANICIRLATRGATRSPATFEDSGTP